MDINLLSQHIDSYIPRDLKHTRDISDSIIAYLAAYVAFFVSCHTKVEKLIWFSDRGPVYDFLDGICIDLYNYFYHNLLYAPIQKPTPFGIGKENPHDSKLWYDSLVRLADYNAGTLASCNLFGKTVDKYKHLQLLENVLADNPNFNTIKIFFEDQSFQTAHVNISKVN